MDGDFAPPNPSITDEYIETMCLHFRWFMKSIGTPDEFDDICLTARRMKRDH